MWLLESRVCLAEKQPSRNRTKAELWRSGVPDPQPHSNLEAVHDPQLMVSQNSDFKCWMILKATVAIHRIGVFRALSGAF